MMGGFPLSLRTEQDSTLWSWCAWSSQGMGEGIDNNRSFLCSKINVLACFGWQTPLSPCITSSTTLCSQACTEGSQTDSTCSPLAKHWHALLKDPAIYRSRVSNPDRPGVSEGRHFTIHMLLNWYRALAELWMLDPSRARLFRAYVRPRDLNIAGVNG